MDNLCGAISWSDAIKEQATEIGIPEQVLWIFKENESLCRAADFMKDLKAEKERKDNFIKSLRELLRSAYEKDRVKAIYIIIGEDNCMYIQSNLKEGSDKIIAQYLLGSFDKQPCRSDIVRTILRKNSVDSETIKKVSKMTGVPANIVSVALNNNEKEEAIALLERLKAAAALLTPEQRENLLRCDHIGRLAIIGQNLSKADIAKLKCNDLMVCYDTARFLYSCKKPL